MLILLSAGCYLEYVIFKIESQQYIYKTRRGSYNTRSPLTRDTTLLRDGDGGPGGPADAAPPCAEPVALGKRTGLGDLGGGELVGLIADHNITHHTRDVVEVVDRGQDDQRRGREEREDSKNFEHGFLPETYTAGHPVV